MDKTQLRALEDRNCNTLCPGSCRAPRSVSPNLRRPSDTLRTCYSSLQAFQARPECCHSPSFLAPGRGEGGARGLEFSSRSKKDPTLRKATRTLHPVYIPIYIYIYIIIYIYIYLSLSVYIYIERERERESEEVVRSERPLYTVPPQRKASCGAVIAACRPVLPCVEGV